MGVLEKPLERQPRLPRFLCHLFQRREQGRLNLVTGAGISIDAGVPSWHRLLDRLAERSDQLKTDLQRHRKTGLHPEYLGQIIYNRHRAEWQGGVAVDLREATINYEWAQSIHDAIYKDVPHGIDEVVKSHPYLAELRDLALQVPLVINFNFDDILSDAISQHSATYHRNQGGSSTVVWQPPLIDRENTTTIYHVNGILPRVSLKKRSPQLIFTEDSFSDALARSPGVSGELLFLRFVQNTMLIVGHSLSDSSLKNYLRRNRDKSPANHHYMIYFLTDSDEMTVGQLTDIFQANLELYNLITIFLTSEEMREFFALINKDVRGFRDIVDQFSPDKRSRFHYYIVGPVASGKSTLLEHLRCFSTFEEWTRPPPKEMYLSVDKLNESSKRKIDEFVYSELKEKNYRMDASGVGFHFMDRAPLDLYAFSTNDNENKQKTAKLKNIVTCDKALQPGEIVFVTASGHTLVRRNLGRGRKPGTAGDEKYVEDQGKVLHEIYDPGLILDTDNHSAGDAAKLVARQALLQDYEPKDLGEIMSRYQ